MGEWKYKHRGKTKRDRGLLKNAKRREFREMGCLIPVTQTGKPEVQEQVFALNVRIPDRISSVSEV